MSALLLDHLTAAEYAEQVEKAFQDIGGAATFSPADWMVVQEWIGDRVPLSVALEGIRESGGKARIRRLAYCAPAVRRGFVEHQKVMAPAFGYSREGEVEPPLVEA